jgi:hypothetical protein
LIARRLAAGRGFPPNAALAGIGIGLAPGWRMRNRLLWVMLATVAVVLVAQYSGVSERVGARLTSLANQPGVATAFQDPESGRTDALTALIAFSVLTPIAAGVALMALVLVAKGLEAVVVSVRLPGWLSTPVVGVAAVVTMYVTSQAWLPASLHGLGLVARAYLVYAHGSVPIIR